MLKKEDADSTHTHTPSRTYMHAHAENAWYIGIDLLYTCTTSRLCACACARERENVCARENVCVHGLLVGRHTEAAVRTKHVTALAKALVSLRLTYVVGPLDIQKQLASRILAPQW